MADFDIPNYGSATLPEQAAPDHTDYDIIAQGFGVAGVITGCVVTWTSARNFQITAGQVWIGNTVVTVSLQTFTVANGPTTANYRRIDLITIDLTGTVIQT